MKLSCLILTKNNGNTLRYAMESIKSYVDEIVLLDSGSDDETLEIAKEFDAKIYYHEFNGNFGEQRNYGMSLCHGDWIFMLDADELVGVNFHRVLRYLKEPYRSIALPRSQVFDIHSHKQIITYTHYYDWQTRLIRNDGQAYYKGDSTHETIQNAKPRLHCCEANIIHLQFLVNNYEMRKKKVDYYNSISNEGFPTMFLPEDYTYNTMTMMELPEKKILDALKEDLLMYKYELRDKLWITIREHIKWNLRQLVTQIRGLLSI